TGRTPRGTPRPARAASPSARWPRTTPGSRPGTPRAPPGPRRPSRSPVPRRCAAPGDIVPVPPRRGRAPRSAVADGEVERRGPGAELLVESRGPVRLVTLNRPDALNATNEELHRELALVWPDLAADPDVRAIVLTGAGRAFCGGGDLHLLQRSIDDADL